MQKNIQDVKKRCAGANGGVEEKNQREQLNDMDDVKENKGDRKNNVCTCVGGVREPEEERFTLNL